MKKVTFLEDEEAGWLWFVNDVAHSLSQHHTPGQFYLVPDIRDLDWLWKLVDAEGRTMIVRKESVRVEDADPVS